MPAEHVEFECDRVALRNSERAPRRASSIALGLAFGEWSQPVGSSGAV